MPKIKDPNVLIGFDSSDDACVYRVNDEVCLINSIDFFPPMVDDPYTFGQIAAANSLSDIYAMGGEPKLCMNLLTFPNELPLEAIQAILEGGNDKVNECGAMITGGHSINDHEPKYGLSVTGFAHPEDILSNSAEADTYLLLTKSIGTGMLTTAAKVDLLDADTYNIMVKNLTRLNKYAWEAMKGVEVSGCTDVTGFGLMGHAAEMAKAGNVTLELYADRIPIYEKSLEFAKLGIMPAAVHNNVGYLKKDVMDYSVNVPQELKDCLYDPQTSGGLLIAVKKDQLERLRYQLGEVGCRNDVIGYFKPKQSHYVELLNR